jgi:hypothetical protein
MYVKLKSSFQIISLPDDFLTLKEVTEETVEFDVKYLFDQEKGIKQNATKISIDISKTLPPNSANSKISLDLYKSILTTHRDHVESLIDYQNKSVIKSQNSDPTTSVDNELVHLFNKGYNLNQLPQAKKRQLKVIPSSKKTNNIEPIHVQHDIGEYYNGERQLAEEILFRGLDPSDSYQLNDLGLSIEEAYEGIHAQSPVVFKNEDEKLLYKYKNLAFLKPISTINPGEPGKVIDTNPSTDEFVVASVQETVSLLPIIEPVKFNYNSDDQDKLYLIIKVSDVNDVTIQTIIRTFNPKDYIKFYSIPTIPPFVDDIVKFIFFRPEIIKNLMNDSNAKTNRLIESCNAMKILEFLNDAIMMFINDSLLKKIGFFAENDFLNKNEIAMFILTANQNNDYNIETKSYAYDVCMYKFHLIQKILCQESHMFEINMCKPYCDNILYLIDTTIYNDHDKNDETDNCNKNDKIMANKIFVKIK